MKLFKKFLSLFLRIGVSIIFLFILFRHIDSKSLFDVIQHADKKLLLLAFFISSLNYVFCLFRWEMLLKAVQIHLALKRIVISFAGGVFFNTFLPSTIGGDLMRSLDLASHTKRPREVIATVLLDRLSGYVGLVLVTLVAMMFGWRLVQDPSVLLAVALIVGILVALLLVLFNSFLFTKINALLESPRSKGVPGTASALDRIRDSLKNLHHEMHVFREKKKIILCNLLFSIAVQAVTPLAFYVIALSFGADVNIIYFFVFLPVISAITLLPISIGGLGLRDATTVFFFAKAGMSKDIAFAMSLVSFFFILIVALIGGTIYIMTINHRKTPEKGPRHIK